jgi:SAM-dependent methyltransferase
VLCLAEGEGRNAVFLAERGFDVTAVDQSAVGLQKAVALAVQRGVRIATVVADLADWNMDRPGGWGGIVSIWCHLPSALRARVHRQACAALQPGGVLILEAYTPEQLKFRTGGPADPDLMPTLAQLRSELAGLSFEVAHECQREVHEGRGHDGPSAVVQVVARRPT